MLFQKAGFSENRKSVLESQGCNAGACMTRKTMNLCSKLEINNFKVKLDFRCNCATKGVIYLALCKLCDDPKNLNNFYWGQTRNSLMTRNNGHRSSFSVQLDKYDKSALSMHIFDKHLENFTDKLNNYNFGVVKHVAPTSLDRTEDFYIYSTEADIKGLNRYKVTK